MSQVMHRIGDDGWPDAIWQGVNDQMITLNLSRFNHRTAGHVDVRTPDGMVRGEVGDLIIRDGKGQFMVLHKPSVDWLVRLDQGAGADVEPEPKSATWMYYWVAGAVIAAVVAWGWW